MPKLRETLLQVKERHRRELRLRTQVRCAQLLAEGELCVPDCDNIEEHPNVAQGQLIRVLGRGSIAEHPNVAQGRLRVPGRDNIEEQPNVQQGQLRVPGRDNIEEHQTSKDWTTCIIEVSTFQYARHRGQLL